MDKEEMDRNNKIINWVCEDLIVRKMLDDKVFEPLGIERALDLAINKAREEGAKAERERIQYFIDNVRLKTRNYIDNNEARLLLNKFEKELKKENKNV